MPIAGCSQLCLKKALTASAVSLLQQAGHHRALAAAAASSKSDLWVSVGSSIDLVDHRIQLLSSTSAPI